MCVCVCVCAGASARARARLCVWTCSSLCVRVHTAQTVRFSHKRKAERVSPAVPRKSMLIRKAHRALRTAEAGEEKKSVNVWDARQS